MNLRDLVANEDFKGLPIEEKDKVIARIAKDDSDFMGLPDSEKQKVISTIRSSSNVDDTSALNIVKSGTAEEAGIFAGLLSAFGEAAGQQFKGMEFLGVPSPKETSDPLSAFSGASEDVSSFVGGQLGVNPYTPATDISGRMIESGLKAAGSPSSLIGGSIPGMARNLLSSIGISASSEATGDIGADVEKSITGDDSGIGRAIGGISSIGVSAGITAAGRGTFGVGKGIYDKYRGVSEEGEKALAVGTAKRLLEKASTGESIDDIESLISDFDAISNKLDKTKLPLFVTLSDNPVIRTTFINQFRTDESFRKVAEEQLEELAKQIDNNADKIFGARFTELPSDTGVGLKNVKKAIGAIDDKIEKQANAISPTMSEEAIGNSIVSLVENKKKLVTRELSPQYAKLIEDATAEGISLPPESSRVISSFIRENNLRDIFGKGTPLDNKIMKVLSPRQTQAQTTVGATGVRRVEATSEFPSLSFEDVDSLKRAINSLKRNNLSPEQARKVGQLEDIVLQERGNLPGGYNERLKELDKAYYERLGVPFSSANINDIDAKKYAEQVAPTIIKNGSGLKQFLNAVGQDGVPIAKNALLSEVFDKVVSDKGIDLRKLSKYMKDKKEVIELIPGMREELAGIAVDNSKLYSARGRLNEAYNQQEQKLANSFLKGQEGSPDFTTISNRAINDRVYLNKVLDNDLKMVSPETKKAVVNNIRREIVNTAISSGDAIAFFKNPRNKYAISRLFGSGYEKSIEGLLKVADNINSYPIDRIPSAVSKSDLDSVAGFLTNMGLPNLDLPYLSSTVRDRITSPVQKGFRIFSRVNQGRVDDQTREIIQSILIDPDGLKKFKNIAESVNYKSRRPEAISKITNGFLLSFPRFAYTSQRFQDNPNQVGGNVDPNEYVGGEFQ